LILSLATASYYLFFTGSSVNAVVTSVDGSGVHFDNIKCSWEQQGQAGIRHAITSSNSWSSPALIVAGINAASATATSAGGQVLLAPWLCHNLSDDDAKAISCAMGGARGRGYVTVMPNSYFRHIYNTRLVRGIYSENGTHYPIGSSSPTDSANDSPSTCGGRKGASYSAGWIAGLLSSMPWHTGAGEAAWNSAPAGYCNSVPAASTAYTCETVSGRTWLGGSAIS